MYSAWSGTVVTNMQQAYQQFYAVLFTVPDIFLSYWQLSTLFWPAWEMQIQCLLHGRGHAGSLARERGHIGSLFTSSTGCIDIKRVKTFCRYSVQAVYFCLCGQSFKWNHLLKYKSIKIYNKLSRVNYLKKKKKFIFTTHFLCGPGLDFSGRSCYAAWSEKAVQRRVYTQQEVCDTVSVSTFATGQFSYMLMCQ